MKNLSDCQNGLSESTVKPMYCILPQDLVLQKYVVLFSVQYITSTTTYGLKTSA